MKFGRFLVGIFASASLTMFNVFLLVMLIWSVNVSKAQQFDSAVVNNQDLTSASAAVIQGKDEFFLVYRMELAKSSTSFEIPALFSC